MNIDELLKDAKEKREAKDVALRLKGITNVETIRSGQVSAYKDSIYEYKITSTASESEVLEVCLNDIHKCNKENKGSDFSGNCSFPFGLDSFYQFGRTSENTFRYRVCSPFTD